MPNHCQNHLTIVGHKEDLQAFAAAHAKGDTEFCYESSIPEPPEGDPQRIPSDSHEGGWDWYTWRVKHWGSKWDTYSVSRQWQPDQLLYRFQTAWAPTLVGTKKLSELYPDLEFVHVWMEWGMGDFGKTVFVSGLEISSEAHKINWDSIEFDDYSGEVISMGDDNASYWFSEYGFETSA